MVYTVILYSNVKRIHAETPCLPFFKGREAAVTLVTFIVNLGSTLLYFVSFGFPPIFLLQFYLFFIFSHYLE